MSERFDQLSAKHKTLRLRTELERRQLAQAAHETERHLAGIDRSVNAVRRIVRNPALVVGAIGIVVFVGPKRVLGFASRAFMLYTTARRLLRLRRGG